MAFNDLLSSSFLFSIAIIIILIGGIFAYVSYRMSEQDHKITSMLGLISTMAEELQFFRSRTERVEREERQERQDRTDNIMISPVLDPNNLVPGINNYPSLISVSDDESESDDETESDDESEDDQSGDEDDDMDEDDQEETDIKEILNLDDQDDQDDQDDTIDLDDLVDLNRDETIKSIHLETPIDLNISKEEEPVDELFVGDLKTISIMDLEESNKKPDYKKMSLNKLREVVVEKGLIVDASKMKKPELLKLLGDE
jgi:hypothetical protein